MPIKTFQQFLLPNDPAAPLQASTKQYSDGLAAASQPLDADLSTIAGLTATTDNVIQSVAGNWASRTMAQLKATLALAVGDVSGAAPLAGPTFTGLVTAPRVVGTPQTQSVTTTLAIDAATGDNHQITATGNPAFGVPANGTNGQMLLVEVLASGGARTVTLNGSIVLTAGLTASIVIASGEVGFFGLRYSALAGNVWVLLSMTQSL